MNKVLIISSEFLPYKSGGTIRSEKLAKYLPEFGWASVILCKKPPKNYKPESYNQITYCNVYRIHRFDITIPYLFFKGLYKKSISRFKVPIEKKETKEITRVNFSHNLIVPDIDLFWVLPAVVKGLFVIWKEKPKIILASGPPHSMYLIGYLLKKLTNIKLILDFRDPWTFNPFNEPRKFQILDIIDNFLERETIKKADSIVVVTPIFKQRFLEKYSFLQPERILFIPNGFDPDDFIKIPSAKNDKFVIVHTGFFYQKRSSKEFIMAILNLLENGILKKDRLEIRFAGGIDSTGEKLIAESQFKNTFKFLGKISHTKSINEICNADLLLLVPGPGEGTFTGKFFEYLATSKPIFCMANEGPAKELINKHHLGIVSSDNDVTEIMNKLILLINEIIEGKFIYPNIEELKKQFNRKDIAGQMANHFNMQLE